MSATTKPQQVCSFEHELLADPALVARIVAEFPAVEEPEVVIIRTDTAGVDTAIVKSLALAVAGVEARIELINQ